MIPALIALLTPTGAAFAPTLTFSPHGDQGIFDAADNLCSNGIQP